LKLERKLKANKEDKVAKAMERFSEKQLDSSVPEFIAQLTLVDGATLLCPDLDVLGFGVRLKSANDPPPAIVVIDPREGKAEVSLAFDDFHRGTRHKSAAQFVFDNRNSIAIVCVPGRQRHCICLENAGWIRHRLFARL
jgi:hypothetical protein